MVPITYPVGRKRQEITRGGRFGNLSEVINKTNLKAPEKNLIIIIKKQIKIMSKKKMEM
jgi:hypothetical protein